ncbi:MAG TPA: prolyl oligopeptidase family serine peptidase [Saprospiraceae bacterium]|nr:prolyl oligopeptidase family serine peptidase [Saprospiraceae bacterium]HMP22970.1 prolyl oligopeptidase family serine peptidase [Saprospiraceae bacterium]
MKLKQLFFSLLLIWTTITLGAQSGPSLADYKRADRFQRDYFRSKVHNVQITPNWFADSTGFWYEIAGKDTRTFRRVDFPILESQPAFDHEKLAAALQKSFDLQVAATNLPLRNLTFKGKDTLEFRIEEQGYSVSLKTFAASKKTPESRPARNEFEVQSPDGKWIAFSRDYNLYLRSTVTGEETPLSQNGQKGYEYASYYGWGDIIEGENGTRPRRFTATWSPDSKMILTSICDTRVAQKMYLLDWSVDTLYRPKLLGYYRGSPGDSTVVYIKPVLFEVENRHEIAVDIQPLPHFASVSLRWLGNDRLVGHYWQRGYKQLNFVQVEAASGAVKNLYTEASATSVNNAFYVFRLLEKAGKILFTSEQSGWNHLYLLDIPSGQCTQLTRGEFMVNDLVFVDEQRQRIYFTAMGKEPGRNIYLQQLYQIDFAGKETQLLTPENAHHIVQFSPDGRYFVDNYSTVTQATVTVLRSTDNRQARIELAKADATELFAMGWRAPETYIVPGADGESPVYCAIWKPTNFDPARSYPIIESVYTGPFTFRYPRSFAQGLVGNHQALAELGFVVITIDGRGSAGRSKAFRDYSYKRLGFSLEDHVFAIRTLAQQHSWLDAGRVGIFGHSAGGYDAARALLQYHDLYKVAVSSAGDHDHRMEKAWWPEMYMGWPVDSAYHLQSNITMAANLQGKLLLVHGGIDENVNPSATFKLSEALIKANKDFDLLIIPSQRHGFGGLYNDYFNKKRMNYFVEHLLGAIPIWDYEN